MNDDCTLESFFSPFEIEYLKLRTWASRNKSPISLTIELTPYCNFNCPMCYVHLTPEQAKSRGKLLTTAQWLDIMSRFADLGLLAVNISGGEALLRPDFWEIYEGISRMGIIPSVFTNGYLIDEKVIEHFKEYPPRQVKISLYGGCDETYEKMCGVKNGFTRVSHAVDLLKEAGIPLMTTVVFVKQNIEDMPLMDQFAKEKGIRIKASSEIGSAARGADTDPDAARIELPIRTMPLKEILTFKREPFKSLFERCPSYGRTAVITWNGRLQACNFFEHEYIQLEEPYDIAASWEQLWNMADAIKLPPECVDCPDAEFCRACPGIMAGGSGYVDRLNPALCPQAKLLHQRYDELMAAGAPDAEGTDHK